MKRVQLSQHQAMSFVQPATATFLAPLRGN